MTRPILVDLQDGPCEICEAHLAGKCDRCKEAFPTEGYANMWSNGYQAVKPNHFHLEVLAADGLTVPARRAFHEELCLGCYRQNWTEVYNQDAPV